MVARDRAGDAGVTRFSLIRGVRRDGAIAGIKARGARGAVDIGGKDFIGTWCALTNIADTCGIIFTEVPIAAMVFVAATVLALRATVQIRSGSLARTDHVL